MDERYKDKLEKDLAEKLAEGELEAVDPQLEAKRLLPPKYEIRIPAVTDPIREETEIYRSMAKEVDGRYDRYGKNDRPPGDLEPDKE